jgi:tRNA U34 5-methylaminomethyl-2-thiouridine-forming methyltransferase MnmC
MKIEPIITGDGSTTLFVRDLNEHYHSTFGAITESGVVFIDAGLKPVLQNADWINVLEIGFGTGLNALLSFLAANGKTIHYTTIEAFPVDQNIIEALNFSDFLKSENAGTIFGLLHQVPWETEQIIADQFFITKCHSKIEAIVLPDGHFDLVYFDAFGPEVQPELWTVEIFSKIGKSMKKGGVLTTYSAKGQIRRNLQSAGFIVEKLPGPPGKRHITRATKS